MNNRLDKNAGSDEALIIVALGCNLSGAYGSRLELLQAVLAAFGPSGLVLVKCSSWWRSAAWPNPDQPDYLNGVVVVETALDPPALLKRLLAIERAFGRERGAAHAPRTVDLDLIAHGRLILSGPALTLPHPRAAERLFVMGPLAQIAPDWRHPQLGVSARDLARHALIGADATPIAAA